MRLTTSAIGQLRTLPHRLMSELSSRAESDGTAYRDAKQVVNVTSSDPNVARLLKR